MAVSVPRRLFTVDEYYEMARVGILKPDERTELLDGEIVPMNPINSPHAWCVKRLAQEFGSLGRQIIVSVQDPLQLGGFCAPQPDLAILRPDAPQDRHPGPAETLLVIEVADSSVRHDRERKMPIYARYGIPELWIVDLNADRIDVHREPAGRRFRRVTNHARGDTVSPLHLPDLLISVSHVLGGQAATT